MSSAAAQKVHVIGWNSFNGEGSIFRSEDGGVTWQKEGAGAYTEPGSFPDVIHFFDPQNGVIFGGPAGSSFEIYTTANGGDSWSRVPSNNIPAPLMPNEYGLSNLGDAFGTHIWVMTASFDTTFPFTKSRLLQSDDKGQHWYVRNPAIAYDGSTLRVKFRDELVGLYQNNDKLYRTVDGGTTWAQVDYSGPWFKTDFDNVPGKPGWWISVGGNFFSTQFGSSISYDDGAHWVALPDTFVHTCLNMTSPIHGYSGGISTASANDGVFVFSLPPGKLPD